MRLEFAAFRVTLTRDEWLGNEQLALGGLMRAFVVVVVAAFALSGCASMPDHQRKSLVAAGVGAGLGAAVGAATGGAGLAIAAGAVGGGAAGGIIAAYAGPHGCFYRNHRGELWKVPCEDTRVKAEACFVGRAPNLLEEVYCPWKRKGRRL
jgi:hypothetical protein